MLKKILPIFFILCLVFSLTVPCFAEETDPPDYQVSLYNLDPISNFYQYNYSSGVGHREYGSNSVTITASQLANYDCVFSFNQDFIASHVYYLCYFATGDGFLTRNYVFGTYILPASFTVNSDDPTFYSFTFTAPQTTRTDLYIGCIGPIFSIRGKSLTVYSPLLIDLTDIYGEDVPTRSTVDSFILSYGVDENFDWNPGFNFLHIPGFFDPFLNFHSHLFETFSFFPELGSTYSALFTFVIIITSVLVFIFLVVFMIKRFTGGKT